MGDKLLPAGSLVKVEAEIRIPVAATEDQIREHLRYAMTESGGCSVSNPLLNEGVDAWDFECAPTGFVGQTEEYGHVVKEDGLTYYHTRRTRTRANA